MLSIHLGAHKTASTHLQQCLRVSREQLRSGGVFYAGPVLLRDRMPLGDALAQGKASRAAREFTRLLAEHAANQPRMLLSDENILGGTHRNHIVNAGGVLYPAALRRVRQVIDMAGRVPVTLFLSLRDPATFNISAFALQVSVGQEIEIGAYLRGRDPTRLPWAGLLRRLAQIERVERIVVWCYEDYRAVRSRVLAAMLGNELAGQVPDLPPSNVSMTQAGYDWFVSRAMADSDADLRDLVREAQASFPRAEGHMPLNLFPEEILRRSASNYASEVDLVRTVPKVDFLMP